MISSRPSRLIWPSWTAHSGCRSVASTSSIRLLASLGEAENGGECCSEPDDHGAAKVAVGQERGGAPCDIANDTVRDG
jgi:hypothetical protein